MRSVKLFANSAEACAPVALDDGRQAAVHCLLHRLDGLRCLSGKSRRQRRGFSMVECLVALVVLSVGMLGVAGLMLAGLRVAHGAMFRTQAVSLVSDMAERIRANPSAGSAYECATYGGAPSDHGCAPSDSAIGGNCSTAELAEDDLARWQRSANALLPLSPDTCSADVVYVTAGAPDEPARFRVSLSWLERGEALPIVYRSDLLLASAR